MPSYMTTSQQVVVTARTYTHTTIENRKKRMRKNASIKCQTLGHDQLALLRSVREVVVTCAHVIVLASLEFHDNTTNK